MTLQEVFHEVAMERAYQRMTKGYTFAHDDNHSVRDWISFMVAYLGRAAGPGTDWGRDIDIVRTCFIKVAALAVAAVQAIDRALEPPAILEPTRDQPIAEGEDIVG
jgi:hypothetical protein